MRWKLLWGNSPTRQALELTPGAQDSSRQMFHCSPGPRDHDHSQIPAPKEKESWRFGAQKGAQVRVGAHDTGVTEGDLGSAAPSGGDPATSLQSLPPLLLSLIPN